MKTFPWILFLLAVAAALVLYAWGDRQAQSARECAIALSDLHRSLSDGTLPPPDASPESVARAVARLAAERTAAVERSVAPLQELPARFEALRVRAEAAEAALAKADDARAAAVAAARAEGRATAAKDLAAARAEADTARRERENAERDLVALQIRFNDARATIDALLNSSSDVIDVEDTDAEAETGDAAETDVDAPESESEPETDSEPGTLSLADGIDSSKPAENAAEPETEKHPESDPDSLPEPAEDTEPAEPEETTESIVAALHIPDTPSTDADTDAAPPMAPATAIGRSTRFLTFTYTPATETLDVQLLDGTLLQYAPVPSKTAEKLRTAGDRVDDRFNSLVRNRIPCSADEKAAFKALRSARLPAETALWTQID